MINENLATLIKEELEQMLSERRKRLNLDDFNKLSPHRHVRLQWLRLNGHKLGEGSSRIVYTIDSSKVLKQALNIKGVAQNKAELEIYTSPNLKPIVAEIYDYDPKGEWLVSEIVRPMSEDEFESYTDISFHDFTSGVAFLNGDGWENQHGEMSGEMYQDNSYVKAAFELVEVEDLNTADLFVEEHWGKTADGRIVVLDYGYTDEVDREHYSGTSWGNSPSASNWDTNNPDGETNVK